MIRTDGGNGARWAALGLALALSAVCACGRSRKAKIEPVEPERGAPIKPPSREKNPAPPVPAEVWNAISLLEPEVRWTEPARPGPAVLLRLRRAPGKALFYEGTLDREQEGSNRFVETAQFYLTFGCAGRSDEGFDKVWIRRTFLDRAMKETLASGKTVENALENTSEFLDLGPNTEAVGHLRCYAFDGQNRVAYRTDHEVLLADGTRMRGIITKQDEQSLTIELRDGPQVVARSQVRAVTPVPLPHVLRYDTPHYFLPIFSRNAVQPGDVWIFRVPVVIPVPQAGGALLLPSQFDVRMWARLREVQGVAGAQTAVVDYQFHGGFDTQQEPYASRFTPEFRGRNRVAHGVTGQGTVRVDVEAQRIVAKEETFTVTLAAVSSVPVSPSEPPRPEGSWARIRSRMTWRFLPPGAQLRNGERVPPAE